MDVTIAIAPRLELGEYKLVEDELRDISGEIGSTSVDVVVNPLDSTLRVIPLHYPDVDLLQFTRTMISYFEALQRDGDPFNAELKSVVERRGPITLRIV